MVRTPERPRRARDEVNARGPAHTGSGVSNKAEEEGDGRYYQYRAGEARDVEEKVGSRSCGVQEQKAQYDRAAWSCHCEPCSRRNHWSVDRSWGNPIQAHWAWGQSAAGGLRAGRGGYAVHMDGRGILKAAEPEEPDVAPNMGMAWVPGKAEMLLPSSGGIYDIRKPSGMAHPPCPLVRSDPRGCNLH